MAKAVIKVTVGKKKARVQIDNASMRDLYVAREVIDREMEIIQSKKILAEIDEQNKEILG